MLPRLAFVLFTLTLFTAGCSVVSKEAKLEQVVPGMGMPDGPAWSGKALYFPDVKKQQIYRYDPATKKTELVRDKAGLVSAMAFHPGRGVLMCEHVLRKISQLDGEAVKPLFEHAESKPPRNPNDLAVAKDGGIYHTLTSTDEVWYNSADGKQSLAVAPVPKPNGIALSPNGKTLYVSAFVDKKVHAFGVKKDGTLGEGRVIASMDDGSKELGADGMTCDSRGNIYCTGPKHVWVWSPKGELITKIELPQKPINCEFGDTDGKSLYITAGDSIYRLRMNVKGAW